MIHNVGSVDGHEVPQVSGEYLDSSHRALSDGDACMRQWWSALSRVSRWYRRACASASRVWTCNGQSWRDGKCQTHASGHWYLNLVSWLFPFVELDMWSCFEILFNSIVATPFSFCFVSSGMWWSKIGLYLATRWMFGLVAVVETYIWTLHLFIEASWNWISNFLLILVVRVGFFLVNRMFEYNHLAICQSGSQTAAPVDAEHDCMFCNWPGAY